MDNLKSIYLSIFEHERHAHVKNGLYEAVMISLAYNTNRIEGSTLTLSDTQMLYERGIVPTGGHRADHIIESRNHFALFDFMLDTIREPLTERLIKEFHQRLKHGTMDAHRYGAGQYKTIPNTIGGRPVAQPHEVPELMEKLLNRYNRLADVTLDDIVQFHYDFETIHPFQDGNGRVGRMVMFRQCLEHDLTPFIIIADKRQEYFEALEAYEKDPALLKKQIQGQQTTFKQLAEPFVSYRLEADYER